MTTPFNSSIKALCATASLGALCACAGLDQMTADFDKRWSTASAAPPSKEVNITAVVDPAFAAGQRDKLIQLDAATSCDKIRELALVVMARDPADRMARLQLADCEFAQGDLVESRRHYTHANDLAKDVRSLKGLAFVEMRDGHADIAKSLLAEAGAIEAEPNWTLVNATGFVEDMMGNPDVAQAAFLRAAELAPSKGAPMNNLGMSYLRQERYSDAIAAFAGALNREPRLTVAALNMRIAHAALGDYAVALAGATDDERALVLNSVGTAALAHGDAETARWLFQQALDADPVFYSNAYDNLQRAQASSIE